MIKTLDIYLPDHMIDIAQEKPKSFYSNVKNVFEAIDFKVNFVEARDDALLTSFKAESYALFHRNRPWHENSLEARPAPFGPFWSIDKTADPAQKRIYGLGFNPNLIDGVSAARFFGRQLNRPTFAVENPSTKAGYVFVALQGLLSKQRSWQSMTPLEMVQRTVEIEEKRPIFIKLHPNEQYSDEELTFLHDLCDGDRIRMVEGDLNALMASCAYTVSMNSAVSFKALLFGKPGILFGDAEFHHPFQNVRQQGLTQCFDGVLKDTVEYEKYIFWYLRKQMIHNFAPSTDRDILRHCKNLGWKLGE